MRVASSQDGVLKSDSFDDAEDGGFTAWHAAAINAPNRTALSDWVEPSLQKKDFHGGGHVIGKWWPVMRL